MDMDDDFYPEMAKLTGTAVGQVRLMHVLPEFEYAVRAYREPAERPRAEALLKSWMQGADPLKKHLAAHWVSRAKAIVENGMQAANTGPRRKVHPVLARIMAARKDGLSMKKFDESKHKRDHGEFASEGGAAAPAASSGDGAGSPNASPAPAASTSHTGRNLAIGAGAAAATAYATTRPAKQVPPMAPPHVPTPEDAAKGTYGTNAQGDALHAEVQKHATEAMAHQYRADGTRDPVMKSFHEGSAALHSQAMQSADDKLQKLKAAAGHVDPSVLERHSGDDMLFHVFHATGDAAKASHAQGLVNGLHEAPGFMSFAQHTEASALIRKFLPHLLHAG